MLTWNQLTISEREILASKYGVSCQGEMELQSEEELKKIPEIAWLAMEEKRKMAVEALKVYEKAEAKKKEEQAFKEMEQAKPVKKVKKVVKLGAKKVVKKEVKLGNRRIKSKRK